MTRKKSKWELLVDLPSGARRGMIFQWSSEEDAYVTNEMPWFATPLVPFNYITNRKLFGRRNEKNN